MAVLLILPAPLLPAGPLSPAGLAPPISLAPAGSSQHPAEPARPPRRQSATQQQHKQLCTERTNR